jgi:anaerobic selenocysteine-containing dehydrogenase
MGEIATMNTCLGSGCHAGCIHLTRVKDGKIVKVERVIYPDGEEGTICLKGVAGARLPYHPDRLKYPLKRVGKRGEGKWERVTWEQALDEIADKIKRIREEYKPESVAIQPVWNSTNPLGGIQPMLGFRLRNLLQATELNQGMPIDSNPVFSNYFSFGTSGGSIADPRTLIEGNTKYMIAWGTNPAEMAVRFMRYISEAQERGAKLVDIGLVFDPTAEKADWWIPVKVGSDTALALAMISVIINEKLYDEEYITRYTNGPFLVRTDNGKFLRESDILSEGDPKKYVIWDISGGQPKTIAPKTYGISGFKPALFGTYKPGGIECRPVFQMLADLANQYLPEKVEEITGVSSGTIEKLAREYATTKPAAILISFGLRYKNSGNAYRAMNTLGAITGNIGVMGGGPIFGMMSQGRLNAPLLKFNDMPIIFPTEARAKSIPMAKSFQCMITGKPYPIKVLVIYGANLLHTFPNPRRWIEEVFPNLELVVVNDIFMTATAEYADYVLPDCTVFEREDIDIGYGGHIVLLEKAIEPMYECRPPIYFWSELAKRLGLGEYFDKTIEEWIEFRLNSKDPSIAGIEPPLTLERLKKEKMVRANVPREVHHPFLDKKFPTPSGRIEFYCEELVPAGDALPVFREQLESPRSALAKKYPLVFNTANNKFFMHTMFANDSSILKSYKMEPHISINPQDAKKRDIKDGDVVKVYSDRGSCKVKAMVSEVVPPGVVHIPHGWWPKQFIEGHLANLLLSLASPETRDEAREIFWSVAAERKSIDIAGHDEFRHAYSPDTIFDCLCEVKRVEEDEISPLRPL